MSLVMQVIGMHRMKYGIPEILRSLDSVYECTTKQIARIIAESEMTYERPGEVLIVIPSIMNYDGIFLKEKMIMKKFEYTRVLNKHRLECVKSGEFVIGIKAKVGNMLLQKVGQQVSFEDICQKVYQSKADGFMIRCIDVHVVYLRVFFRAAGYEIKRESKKGLTIQKIKKDE